jgi:hypothetical protein
MLKCRCFCTPEQFAEKLRFASFVSSAKGRLEQKRNGLDAGLKASSTRTQPNSEFFRSL